jgi:hypothetical protein
MVYTVEIKKEGDLSFGAYSKGKKGTGGSPARAFSDLQKTLGVGGAYVIPRSVSTDGLYDGKKLQFTIDMSAAGTKVESAGMTASVGVSGKKIGKTFDDSPAGLRRWAKL